MALASPLNRADLVGTGAQTVFPYTFNVYTTSDLQVYVGGVLQTINSQYTQSPVNVPGGTVGGSVTFIIAPGNTVPVILLRVVPNTQATSFTNLDKFDAKSAIEGSFDRNVMQVQQLAEQESRTLQLPINVTGYGNAIPDPTVVGNQGQFLQIGATQIQAATPSVINFTNPLAAKGDLMGTITGPTPARIAVGTDGQVLEADSTQTTGVGWKQGLRKLATSAGDLLYATASGVFARLAIGATGSILWVTGGLPAWLAPPVGQQILVGNNSNIPTWIGLLSSLSDFLSADTVLNNTGTYFDAKTLPTGSTGIWYVSGQVTLLDTAGAATFNVKLWDGTTTFASTQVKSSAANAPVTAALSALIGNPAGNVRISVEDTTSTSGLIKANLTGNARDSVIVAFRVGQ